MAGVAAALGEAGTVGEAVAVGSGARLADADGIVLGWVDVAGGDAS